MIFDQSVIFIVLLIVGLIYYRLAIRFGIVDKPNHRSSHSKATVRGGGILFPAAVVLWWFAYDFQHTWMVLGLVGLSVVSLLDDIYSLSSRVRFGAQFVALTFAFHDLDIFHQVYWYILPIFYFISLGIINAINFMDGINGITGLYALVFFGSLLAVNTYLQLFLPDLIQYEILAICVFLIFNLRKKALMFAGDIGSISIAYLMIYFLLKWYLVAQSWTLILFLAIFGIDAFLTLLERWRKKENLLEPHRSHFYQLLVNQGKKDHIIIALAYAILQLVINFGLFFYPQHTPNPYLSAILLIAIGGAYIFAKRTLIKKYE
jgi:UDP-N-acetylmuramyl pentapeptide phosphotransferase/UDP-N-acetylglucosamine-1-phosphate transferase